MKHNLSYLKWLIRLKMEKEGGLHAIEHILSTVNPNPVDRPLPALPSDCDSESMDNSLCMVTDATEHLGEVGKLTRKLLSGDDSILKELLQLCHLGRKAKVVQYFLMERNGRRLFKFIQKLGRYYSSINKTITAVRDAVCMGDMRFSKVFVSHIPIYTLPRVSRRAILSLVLRRVFPNQSTEDAVNQILQLTGKSYEEILRLLSKITLHPEIQLARYHLEHPPAKGWTVGARIGLPSEPCVNCEIFLSDISGGWDFQKRSTASKRRLGNAFIGGWFVPEFEGGDWNLTRERILRRILDRISLACGKFTTAENPVLQSLSFTPSSRTKENMSMDASLLLNGSRSSALPPLKSPPPNTSTLRSSLSLRPTVGEVLGRAPTPHPARLPLLKGTVFSKRVGRVPLTPPRTPLPSTRQFGPSGAADDSDILTTASCELSEVKSPLKDKKSKAHTCPSANRTLPSVNLARQISSGKRSTGTSEIFIRDTVVRGD